jgi:hypothetical protein
MELNLETLNQMEAFMEKLTERCDEILKWLSENDPHRLVWKGYYISSETPQNFDFDSDSVYFEVEETWAYGGYEKHFYGLTYAQIISNDWKEDFLKSVENVKAENEAAEEERKKKLEENRANEEKRLYEQLKRKFEG